jgi:gliding motility-associated-like protein
MKRILSLSCLLLLLVFGGTLYAQTTFSPQSSASESTASPKGQDEDEGFIPNAFTPNDDGVNDVFYLPDANYSKMQFSVYDRWGNRVFYSDNPSFRWYGDSAGRQVPQGVYVYVMEASNPRKSDIKRTGTITIVR